MFETGLIVATSLAVGFLLANLALPYLNTWLQEDLCFDAPLLMSVAGFMVALGVVLTFLAGFYPGLMQARFNPVISMKGGAAELPKAGGFPVRRVFGHDAIRYFSNTYHRRGGRHGPNALRTGRGLGLSARRDFDARSAGHR